MSATALRELASRVGIEDGHWGHGDEGWVEASDETRVRILEALGFEAWTDEKATRSLARLHAEAAGRVLEPCRVLDAGAPSPIELGPGASALSGRDLDGVVELEDGTRVPLERGSDDAPRIPALPVGRHELIVEGKNVAGRQWLLATPSRCPQVVDVCGRERVFGLWANLYTLRGSSGAGIGNLTDLTDVCRWTGERGGAFVGVNPLHAILGTPPHFSPYAPISRFFRAWQYLDPRKTEARLGLSSPDDDADEDATHIDYARVTSSLRARLEQAHEALCDATTEQAAALALRYDTWRDSAPPLARDFALYCSLVDRFTADGLHPDWRFWPEPFQHHESDEVLAHASERAHDVDFHLWLQFELDEQLADCAEAARESGLALGLYQDLAVGVPAGSFDTWRHPGRVVASMSLGAPPDAYAADGQVWGLAPLNPLRLREDGHALWRDVVRANLRHAGTLRIDHILGVVRQFWIPDGRPGTEGAYLGFPADELLAVLCIEAHRAGAVVVGEDLGTIPEGLAETLERWGVLSCKVVMFEKDRESNFRPAEAYPPRALVTVNTHDMPPLLGYAAGRDLEIRHGLGALTDEELAWLNGERRWIIERLAERLRHHGLEDGEGGDERLIGPAHHMIASTPAPLAGVGLDDLAGEVEPVNMPGVPADDHPSWTRRMSRPLSEVLSDPETERRLEPARRLRALDKP